MTHTQTPQGAGSPAAESAPSHKGRLPSRSAGEHTPPAPRPAVYLVGAIVLTGMLWGPLLVGGGW